MNNKNSLLLPPEFFNSDLDRKINYILSTRLEVVYLFDHNKNPKDSTKPTYKFI